MKHFFLPYKKLHIWLLSALGVLLVLRLCRGNRAWMNALAAQVTGPFRQALGRLCYLTEVSVMEVLGVLLALVQRIREIQKGEEDDAKNY